MDLKEVCYEDGRWTELAQNDIVQMCNNRIPSRELAEDAECRTKQNIRPTKESKKGVDTDIRGALTGRRKNGECFVTGLFALV
ncbi:hypothetical protein B7P43_G05644 [Cryptotermes secundus]|uniref:Uncharacterized protein n=1 Tax=Cryptotermes secundus TaxID=105785 RepID=A0A2J7RFV0_9NEOP|nr:hypothetical protein B7P43_G05644 [Cryptotermes secundus]